MVLIAAVDENWGIGKNGDLLFRISADLKHFQAATTGKRILLGRKTLATFPAGKPLKNRENYVLTKNRTFAPIGARVFYSVPEVLSAVKAQPAPELFVCGGESVYRQFLPYCESAYITKVKKTALGCDAFCPNLDKDKEWTVQEEGGWQEENGLAFRFCIYKREGQEAG